MNYGIRKYVLGYHRMSRALRQGFTLTRGGTLVGRDDSLQRHCIFSKLDSATPDCPWGRLAFTAKLEGEVVLRVRAFASNDAEIVQSGQVTATDRFLLDPSVPLQRKEQLFGMASGVEYAGHQDVLLYGQTGRYLWIWVEVDGSGTAELGEFRIYVPGDNFFGTFPEVYQTRGEFLHRYLSIFSSMFNDLQEQIDRLDGYVDVDTAPAQALPILANWLGLELAGAGLNEGELRRLLKAAFPLIAAKGTRRAVEGLVRLFVEEPIYIVERNLLSGQGLERLKLYGDTPYDFTVLINRKADERLRERLKFLIEQFKPIRSRVKIVFLGECAGLDQFSYLDINGTVALDNAARLDGKETISGTACLQ